MSHQGQKGKTLKSSFIRAVSHAIRYHRLGDMLTASGLISPKQLEQALVLQKIRRLPLGRVLVQEGFISSTQLYRKLTQQWCIKASAAGVAFMMQTMTPSTAYAEGTNTGIQLASAFSPAAVKHGHQSYKSNLFGSKEIRSNNLKAFTKWTSVMQRFEDQMSTQAASPRVQMWKAQLRDIKTLSDREKIEHVNNYINKVRYIEDKNNYGKSDYWATPIEFFSKGGDCEDFAVAKYASLRALGFSSDQLRIAIVQDNVKRIAHAILIVHAEGQTYILDNQDKQVKTANQVHRYTPVFSINSDHWWLHKTTGV